MEKRIIFFLLVVILSLFLFLGCSNSIWTGQTYSGELTKNDVLSSSWYQDAYKIYCAGTWHFSFTSKDNVKIYMEALDSLTNTYYFYGLGAQNNTNTCSATLLGETTINIYISSNDSTWAANGYKAGYSFTATLR